MAPSIDDYKSSATPRHEHAHSLIPLNSNMRNFWALPAVLRIALASQHAFSVFDDLLAFPQVRCARVPPVAWHGVLINRAV